MGSSGSGYRSLLDTLFRWTAVVCFRSVNSSKHCRHNLSIAGITSPSAELEDFGDLRFEESVKNGIGAVGAPEMEAEKRLWAVCQRHQMQVPHTNQQQWWRLRSRKNQGQ